MSVCSVVIHRPWNEQENDAVMSKFAYCLLTKTLPGKADIELLLAKEECLHRRSWKNVKDFIRNSMHKKCQPY